MLRTYAILVHGFWSNYLRTTPNIHDLLSLLELAICQKFLITMIPHPPSDMEQVLAVQSQKSESGERNTIDSCLLYHKYVSSFGVL